MVKRHLYTIATLIVTKNGQIKATAEMALSSNEDELLGANYRKAVAANPGATVDVRVGRITDEQFLRVLRYWAKED